MGPEPLAEMRGRLSERRSSRDIRNLDRRAREMLAGVRKPTQRHFQEGSEDRHPAPAASGAADDQRARLLGELVEYANPCPQLEEWYHGLKHKNDLPEGCSGGFRCNQPVEEYSEAPQQHADTPSSSAAEPAPAPAGNLHQCDVNWLRDERLVDARLRWERGLREVAGLSTHIDELQAMWNQLSWMSQEKALLAQMVGLIQARRDSAVASDELREMLGRAESALEIHWRGFMKTAADVLNGQQGSSSERRP